VLRSPTATKFAIHLLAVMAEHERDAIFARTKPRLLPPRTKGKKLGNYRRIEAKQRAATARAEAVRPAITEIRHLSTRAPAHELNRRGITTTSGKQ
jgi:DNA invertase Pin-like site-specific DNA recombinase